MNSPNEERKQADNMELLKQQASDCAPGCACHGTGSSGRMRWVLGMIVLLVAATLVARAVIKNQCDVNRAGCGRFCRLPTATTAESPAPADSGRNRRAAPGSGVAQEIASLAELNTLAAGERCRLCVHPRQGWGIAAIHPWRP